MSILLKIAFVAIASTSAVFGDSIQTKIGKPQHLPDYLQIESKPAAGGMLEFVIRVNPDKAAHVDGDNLYLAGRQAESSHA